MILKDKVFVFLGNTGFDSKIQATSLFIARHLAKENKVFFIDYPFTLKDYYQNRNSALLKDRIDKFSPFSDGVIDTDLPNLKTIITPPVIPINFLPEGLIFRSLLKINESIIAFRIRKVLKKYGIKDYIYINSFNFHYPGIAPKIKPSLAIYHCVDPMIMPYDMRHGIVSEEILVKKSDLVICTSRALYLEKIKSNPITYFVPNASDAYHKNGTSNKNLALHEKLVGLQQPIVGYLGTIERRINYDLMAEVIKLNPDKTFVFAGPVDDNYGIQSLVKIPNVHIIGSVPYNEVPQMLDGFTVTVIPFKKDEVSNTIFPIKLFEYLSLGKPVVMTDFNTDLKEYTEDLVDYCEDAESFSIAINNAIKNDNNLIRNQREELAKKNTWENRTIEIAKIISSHLKN